MKLLKMKTGQHQCLVFSLAMLLDEDPDVLIEELGHSGTELWFPGYPVPYSMRGHHIQELVDVCIKRGYSLTPIEFFPRCASARAPNEWKAIWDVADATARFMTMIEGRRGILLGQAVKGGHACAWDGHIVWDPNGRKYPLSEFKIQECWLVAITSE